jgi:hypothetical protein
MENAKNYIRKDRTNLKKKMLCLTLRHLVAMTHSDDKQI